MAVPLNEQYEKEPGVAGSHGQLLEVNLLALFKLQGDQKVKDFHLAGNFKKAGKFDDVVFRYTEDEGRQNIIFLQAKAKLNKKHKVNIGYFKIGGKWELQEYFDSFKAINYEFNIHQDDNPIFRNGIANVDCNYIIYTNAARDDSLSEFTDELEHSPLDVVFGGMRGHALRLKDNAVQDIFQGIHNGNEIDQLLVFNSKLTILTDQPNHSDLEETIKSMVFNTVSIGERNIRFLEVKQKIEAWWQRERSYLYKNDGFLNAIMKGIMFNLNPQLPSFTGRSEQLIELHEGLQENSQDYTAVISQMATVSGLGGIGKSELARQYAHDYQNDYDGNVIWIDADTDEIIEKCFRRLCKDSLNISTRDANGNDKDISSIVQEVYNFFRNRKSLFVFDNANQFSSGIQQYLPSTITGPRFFLITSRNQDWQSAFKLELDIFCDADSKKFVRDQLGILNAQQDFDISELAHQLQNFPLALQQAVAYIRQRNKVDQKVLGKQFTVNDYLIQFKCETKQLLDFKFPDDFVNLYSKTTFITWDITLEQIESLELGHKAITIFNIMAFLSPTDIPIAFFKELQNNSETNPSNAVYLLNKYSMINLHQGIANIHRLVQQVTRLKLDWDKKNVLEESLLLVQRHTDNELIIHGASLWNYASYDNDLVNEFHTVLSKIIIALLESGNEQKIRFLFCRESELDFNGFA